MTCKAIQYSDEMYCPECDLRWDVNDPEPPECRTATQRQIIGVTGAAGAGKSTVAERLHRSHGFTRMKFAGPLKAMIGALLSEMGYSDQMIEAAIEGDMKELPVSLMPNVTHRKLMQTLGTEWGRDTIGEDFWVDVMRTAIASMPPDENIVIDDVRFENEAKLIRDLGGSIVSVSGRGGIGGDHPSEVRSGISWDVQYHNTGTIQDLTAWVDHIFAE